MYSEYTLTYRSAGKLLVPGFLHDGYCLIDKTYPSCDLHLEYYFLLNLIIQLIITYTGIVRTNVCQLYIKVYRYISVGLFGLCFSNNLYDKLYLFNDNLFLFLTFNELKWH